MFGNQSQSDPLRYQLSVMRVARHLKVPRLAASCLDALSFEQCHVLPRQPAIISKACDKWLPCVAHHWDTDRLHQRCGELSVTVSFTRSDARFGVVAADVEFPAQEQMSVHEAWRAISDPAGPPAYIFDGLSSGDKEMLKRKNSLTGDLLKCVSPVLPARVAHDLFRQPFVDEGEHTARSAPSKVLMWLSAGHTEACTHRDSECKPHKLTPHV